MDRRSLLTMFGVAAAAATVLAPTLGDAMPVAPQPGASPLPTGNSAVATDADLAAAKPEKTYWVWRRHRRWRRHYWHRRRFFFRRRHFRHRRWW